MAAEKNSLFILLVSIAAVVVTALSFAGCSGPNSQSTLDSFTGKHPSNWITAHPASFLNNPAQCYDCHGADIKGGISGVSCYSASFNGTACHPNGPSGHPAGWSAPDAHGAAAKSFPNAVATTGFPTCQICHAGDFTGGFAGSSCLNNAACHGASVAAPHSPSPWLTSLTTARTHTNTNPANGAVCGLCHLGNRTPPSYSPLPGGAQPGCFNNSLCHAEPACGSCHAVPPNGTAYPNTAGTHATHMAVNTSIGCSTCHLGAGEGTALHFNGVADVIFDPAYNANSGAASYNPATGTCSNISCHGSSRTQTAAGASTPGPTPAWLTGTIDVNTQCALCHVLGPSAGSPEINSYYSGQHANHVYGEASVAFSQPSCVVCHDTTKLAAVHYASLTAPISEATVAASLNSALNFNGTSCDPSAGGFTGCHGPNPWTGGGGGAAPSLKSRKLH